jgi:cysteinyl-tRNA synthetase
MTNITLHNTKTRKKEPFKPLDDENVRMYVCGPTVYDRAHLGNARPVVVFDVLFRLLKHVYGAGHVTYVRNITDVDDKIIDRAMRDGEDIGDLTARTTRWFHEDIAALGVDYSDDPAFREPRATDYIPQMVAMIESLIASGHAYAAEGHVLFAVESYADYGALSGRSVDDMIAGARVEVVPYKRNPMDFVLWKPSSDDQPGWDGPVVGGKSIGKGRPGWHIECSAMSYALLGKSFDIHGGGLDLQFPHHENEIAQSCCAHPEGEFARVWLHNEMLQVEGKKMSKSLGNFFTVRDLLDGHDGQPPVPGEVIRFVMLSTHYRKPMDWTAEKREEAERTLRKWYRLAGLAGQASINNSIINALTDDLNTPEAITEAHALANAGDVNGLRFALEIFGLWSGSIPDWAVVPGFSDAEIGVVSDLLQRRDAARRQGNYSEADRIRDGLVQAGVKVVDSPDGPMPEKTQTFDVNILDQVWGGQ